MTTIFEDIKSESRSASVSFDGSMIENLIPMKMVDIKVNPLIVSYPWEIEEIDRLFAPSLSSYFKYKILNDFAKKIINETVPLEPAFGKIINDNFWDLI